jgi:hypothetical protein
MSLQSDYSTRNIKNSLAVTLTRKFLAESYCLYWHESDGLETADGYYGEYSTRQDVLLQDSQVAAAFAAAKGLLTIRGPLTASPRFVARPSSSGAVGPQDEIPIPAIAIEVSGPAPVENYELGTMLKWRSRVLTVTAFTRSPEENDLFVDRLAEWLDEDVEVDVLDHDGGTLTSVGSVRLVAPTSESNIQIPGPDFTTYAVEFLAQLEYIA